MYCRLSTCLLKRRGRMIKDVRPCPAQDCAYAIYDIYNYGDKIMNMGKIFMEPRNSNISVWNRISVKHQWI